MKRENILFVVVPCYNEEAVLPITSDIFIQKIETLIRDKVIDEKSKVLLVDDGSTDSTWTIIKKLAADNACFEGLRLSRNRGHQNALLAGLLAAKERCDVTISIDCDGQDDINTMDEMLDLYQEGCDIVYGVRSDRERDTLFKRTTAQGFYRVLKWMGVETIYNHADYRLLSKRALDSLAEFREVNLFLRGMIPLVGFKSASIYYRRAERIAGETHYPLSKMLSLAINGITSLSIKPIRLITGFGLFVSLLSVAGLIWALIANAIGVVVAGWTSTIAAVCFFGGVQMLSLGVIGEYVGKIYMETKGRPRFIISESTLKATERDK